MLSRREFIGLYDQAVLGIRQIKNNNDKINKSIGVVNSSTLYRQTQSDKYVVEGLINKVSQIIQKMERNYLDPETARKIGVVKQQLRIQKDRRIQLSESVNQITKQFQGKRLTPQNEDFSPSKQKKSETPKHFIEMEANDYFKRSMTTDTDNQTYHQQHKSQMEDYDYEIQNRLIHERAQQLNHANERMINIKNIVNQTSELALQQGQKLDIITDDLFMTYKNVTFGNDELDQANKNQRKSKKKYMLLSLFLIVCVGIFVLFMIVA